MPWKSSSARSHTKKASTPKRKRMWAHVANSVLKRTGNDARAVRSANAAVKRAGTRRKRR